MDRSGLDAFYRENVRLIHAVTFKGYGRLKAMDGNLQYDDLFQDMVEVFIKSFEGFNEGAGNKFSSYFYTAAFNRINKIGKKIEAEVIEPGLRTFEQMDSWGEEDGDCAVLDTIAADTPSPEEVVSATHDMEVILNELSPMGAKLVELTLDPPEFIQRELEAAQAHAKFARDNGIPKRSREAINLDFICTTLERTTDIPSATIEEARKEVRKAIREVFCE